ncbi:MAG TPA: hypothetical protein VHX66_14400 [Solirubrobacteraceae bacterium]|nr:hypothetical protein [Solirubrobacteraceae bacterium]
MSDDQPTQTQPITRALPEYAPSDQHLEELPPRPRTRLLTPLSVALALVLFAGCGFVGGVLVEKGQTSSSTGATGLASLLGGGRSGAGASGTAGGSATSGAAGRFASLFGGTGSRGTVGTVANISGDKVYVTTTAGSTVEVVVPSVAKVTKSQSVGRRAIRPGDSLVVTGITASNGTVTASAVTDSGTGGGAGGFASLFGGASSPSSSSSSSNSSTNGGDVSLFGGG